MIENCNVIVMTKIIPPKALFRRGGCNHRARGGQQPQNHRPGRPSVEFGRFDPPLVFDHFGPIGPEIRFDPPLFSTILRTRGGGQSGRTPLIMSLKMSASRTVSFRENGCDICCHFRIKLFLLMGTEPSSNFTVTQTWA